MDSTSTPAMPPVSSQALAERLAGLRNAWLDTAAELLPDSDALSDLLGSRLLELGSRGVPLEADLLQVAEDAAQVALRTGTADDARALSRRLRRAVYEFLLAVDAAANTEVRPAAGPAPTPSAPASGRGAMMIGLEEVSASPFSDLAGVAAASSEVTSEPPTAAPAAASADEVTVPEPAAEPVTAEPGRRGWAPRRRGAEPAGDAWPLAMATPAPPAPAVPDGPSEEPATEVLPPPAIQHDTQWRSTVREWPPVDQVADLKGEVDDLQGSPDAWARPQQAPDAWALQDPGEDPADDEDAREAYAATVDDAIEVAEFPVTDDIEEADDAPRDPSAIEAGDDAPDELSAPEAEATEPESAADGPTPAGPDVQRPVLTLVSMDTQADPGYSEPETEERDADGDLLGAVPYVVPSYRAWADVLSTTVPDEPSPNVPPPMPVRPLEGGGRSRRLSDLTGRASVPAVASSGTLASEPDPGPFTPAVPPASAPVPVAPRSAPAEETSPGPAAAAAPPDPAWPAAAPAAPADPWAALPTSTQSLRAELGWGSDSPAIAIPTPPGTGQPTGAGPASRAATPEGEEPTPSADADGSMAWHVRTSPRQQRLAERMADRRREDVSRAAADALGEPATEGRGRKRGREPMRLVRETIPEQVDELLGRKRGADAAALLQRAAQELAGREVAEVAIDGGDRCRALGQVRAALNCYLAAWRADPLYEESLWRLADTCLGERQVDLAAGYYERIADLMRARGDDAAALQVYRKIATIAPERRDIRDLLQLAAISGRLQD